MVGWKDAALVVTLAPGAYTAPLPATGGGGVALLEVYDASSSVTASVVNASTRAFVGTGDNVLIPGFVISGSGSLRLLIRAVGPTLAGFGVSGTLADPTPTLYRGPTAIATNDNWSMAANATEISTMATAVGAFALPVGSRDAALVVTLEPGSYSAIISGVGNTTGTALVEVYSSAPPATTDTITAGFAITGQTTAPNVPTYLDNVWVTAKVQATAGVPLAQVQLNYGAGTLPPITLGMADDGRHGDGAAGDGVFGAAIPVQAAGVTVSYSLTATDTKGGGATSAPASYLVSAALTDATFNAPEFLGIPTAQSVTLNLEATTVLQVYAEYGSASGTYTGQTPVVAAPRGDVRVLVVHAGAQRGV